MQSNGNTHLNSLTERIKAKTERDTQEIETLTRQQFENLSRSLSESSKNALNTTESNILKNIAILEQTISSRCQVLSHAFDKRYWMAWILSGGIILATVLLCWGLITLSRHQIADLRQEIAALTEQKSVLETVNTKLAEAYPGLGIHLQDGRSYLLLPEGRTMADKMRGMSGKHEAWEIVRK